MAWYKIDPDQENGIGAYTISKNSPGPGWIAGPRTNNAKFMINDNGVIRRRTKAEWNAYQEALRRDRLKKETGLQNLLDLEGPATTNYPNGLKDIMDHADAETYVEEIASAGWTSAQKQLVTALVEAIGNIKAFAARRIQ